MNYFFGGDCLLCGAAAGAIANLCNGCRSDLPLLGRNCPVCAQAVAFAGLCSACSTRTPAFSYAAAPYVYAGEIKYLILRAKFHANLPAMLTLSHLLANWLAGEQGEPPDLIVPVPLHDARLRQRGFNQAAELANAVGRRLDIGVAAHCCVRLRDTSAQSEMSSIGARRRNVRAAFQCRELPADVATVAVVDDVMTTGATVNEIARQLRNAGVKEVRIWVLSRAISSY